MQTMNPLEPPFKDFNSKEWILRAVLILSELGLGLRAASL